jgi:hypothetical protein
MRHKLPDLPDAFVERVKVLELKSENMEKEIISMKASHINHRKETRTIREVIGLFSWIPGGPKAFLAFILAIIFISSLTAEILLKTTGLHLEIRRYLVDILEVK